MEYATVANTVTAKTPVTKSARKAEVREGTPSPRGAFWDGKGVNFALFSAHATKVEVCLFDGAGEKEQERVDLPEVTDEIWHGYIPNLGPQPPPGPRRCLWLWKETVRAARKLSGPWAVCTRARPPLQPNKLLLDPYARAREVTTPAY
jgi:isoamylase